MDTKQITSHPTSTGKGGAIFVRQGIPFAKPSYLESYARSARTFNDFKPGSST